jgi:hypothetical protein
LRYGYLRDLDEYAPKRLFQVNPKSVSAENLEQTLKEDADVKTFANMQAFKDYLKSFQTFTADQMKRINQLQYLKSNLTPISSPSNINTATNDDFIISSNKEKTDADHGNEPTRQHSRTKLLKTRLSSTFRRVFSKEDTSLESNAVCSKFIFQRVHGAKLFGIVSNNKIFISMNILIVLIKRE